MFIESSRGLNLPKIEGSPDSPDDGTMWYDTAAKDARIKADGSTDTIVGGEGSGGLSATKAVISSEALAVNTPVTKLPNGKIAKADATAPGMGWVYGITKTAFADEDSEGEVYLIGLNTPGVLTDLEFDTADKIYQAGPGVFTNDPGILDEAKTLMFIGFADCASGVASSLATDLIMTPNLVAEAPTV